MHPGELGVWCHLQRSKATLVLPLLGPHATSRACCSARRGCPSLGASTWSRPLCTLLFFLRGPGLEGCVCYMSSVLGPSLGSFSAVRSSLGAHGLSAE